VVEQAEDAFNKQAKQVQDTVLKPLAQGQAATDPNNSWWVLKPPTPTTAVARCSHNHSKRKGQFKFLVALSFFKGKEYSYFTAVPKIRGSLSNRSDVLSLRQHTC